MTTETLATEDRAHYSRDICAQYRITDRCLRNWVASGRFPPPDANINGRNVWFDATVKRHRAEVLAGRFSQQRRPGSSTNPEAA